MEIRGECDKKRVRFDSLKEGEPFYYDGELLMKMNNITGASFVSAGVTYNCVSLRHGRAMGCPDDVMVGIARVHIEKEY